MIDFNKGKERLNKFSGSEKKTTVFYDNILYMLKFSDPVRGSKLKGVLSYKNNQYSEHIGSSIFRACGFEVQETILGYSLGALLDDDEMEKLMTNDNIFIQSPHQYFSIFSEVFQYIYFLNQINVGYQKNVLDK